MIEILPLGGSKGAGVAALIEQVRFVFGVVLA